jgi:hypothetical protein
MISRLPLERRYPAPAGPVPKTAGEAPNWYERLLTPKEAATVLRLSISFLAKARIRGDGPAYVKLGRAIRYRQSTLLDWLKIRSRVSTSDQ